MESCVVVDAPCVIAHCMFNIDVSEVARRRGNGCMLDVVPCLKIKLAVANLSYHRGYSAADGNVMVV